MLNLNKITYDELLERANDPSPARNGKTRDSFLSQDTKAAIKLLLACVECHVPDQEDRDKMAIYINEIVTQALNDGMEATRRLCLDIVGKMEK